jgi:RNA ligase (TIGR02306 family)
MSTFQVPIVRIGKVGKHPNADSLSITQADGCPCIFRTGDLNPGDLAIYVPVDSVIQEDTPFAKEHLSFLKYKNGSRRIRAMKIRGLFSMGVLVPLARVEHLEVPSEGFDMSASLGITKYEEAESIVLGGEQERDPGYMPVYDMESYRRHRDIFEVGEEVVVTEKLHGCNARFIHDGHRLWVGSHRTWKRVDSDSVWSRIARAFNLEEKLRAHPMLGIYGEVYGDVQDLKYGSGRGELQFAIFDAYVPHRPEIVMNQMIVEHAPDYTVREHQARYMDFDEFRQLSVELGLFMVPVLYAGPFDPAVVEPLADGYSTFADHIREGIVIKPRAEAWHPKVGRKVLKLVSEAYLLRNDGTERH